jgi:DNA-binding transcriptional LysR family regulator
MLDPRKLRLLVDLADRGTITAVADAAHYTPSTVSHALASLEAEVGVALLERTPRSVRMTPAAHALVTRAREILARLEIAHAETRAVGGLERGAVTIATFPSAGALVVAPALGALRDHRPDLEVRLVSSEPADALAQLRAGSVDVAVVYRMGYAAALGDDLELTPLGRDPMLLCAVPEMADVADGAIDLRTLRDRPFVAGRPRSPCHDLTLEVCRRAGFEASITYETDDIAFVRALVCAGHAVSVMPRALLATASGPVPAWPARVPVPPRRIYAARRAASARVHAAGAVIDELRTTARAAL